MGFGIGEHFAVEDEVAPVEGFHPETVEVEDFNWDVSGFHSFKEGVDCFFVVVCSETCAEPQTETPTWNFAWLSCQDRILLEDLLGGWAVDDVPIPSCQKIRLILRGEGPCHFNL